MNIHNLEYQLDFENNFFDFSEKQQLIYFLVKKNEIVYVGISDTKNVYGRMKAHKKDKDFDRAKYTVLKDATRPYAERLERGLISLIRPKYNKVDCYVQVREIDFAIQYFNGGEIKVNQDPVWFVNLTYLIFYFFTFIFLFGMMLFGDYFFDSFKFIDGFSKANFDSLFPLFFLYIFCSYAFFLGLLMLNDLNLLPFNGFFKRKYNTLFPLSIRLSNETDNQ